MCLMQEWLTPHRAALQEACAYRNIDFNKADTLAMLNPDSAVDHIVACLRKHDGDMEAVRSCRSHVSINIACCCCKGFVFRARSQMRMSLAQLSFNVVVCIALRSK